MTRRRLLLEMDSRELVEWDAFFEIDHEIMDKMQREAALEREALADLRRN
ncbi:MAG: hypothetical protein KGL39_40900 [Patescibacteria group bacterium]|nr:hypothetical protein [Patescibacteria group bacterium]